MYFIGDLHGSFSHLLYTLARMAKRGINLIQVGDFGIGFTSKDNDFKNLGLINEALKEWDAKLYVVRGNHDDPKYFKGALVEEVNETFSNIHFVEDYEVLEIEGKKIFCLGGGISIDRKARTEGKSYWKDEEIYYNPLKLNEVKHKYEHIDIIVTHSAPMWCHPTGIDAPIVRDWCSVDDKLKEDLLEERDCLGVVFDELNEKLKFKYHIYGHFHTNYRKKIADTTHVLLGIGDFLDLDKLIELEKEIENK